MFFVYFNLLVRLNLHVKCDGIEPRRVERACYCGSFWVWKIHCLSDTLEKLKRGKRTSITLTGLSSKSFEVHHQIHKILKCYVRRHSYILSLKSNAIRAERYPWLLNHSTHKGVDVRYFANKKKVMVDEDSNRWNAGVLVENQDQVVMHSKNHASVLSFGAV